MTAHVLNADCPSPYYQDEHVTLYHGDALEVMRSIPSGSIDIAVTSPPYNMGLTPGGNGRGVYRPGANSKGGKFRHGYDTFSDAMDADQYADWQRAVLAEMWRIVRLGIFYNHRPRIEHGLLRDPLGGDYGIPLRQRIIWNRGTGIDVSLRAFCTRGEYILLFAKPEFKLASHSMSGMGDVWNLGMETGADHPAVFPVSLPVRCIESTNATSVLDPFVGSGTTLRAAADLGIQGVGVDISKAYCEMSKRRLAQGAFDLTGM